MTPTYVAFDLETTGLDTNTDAIIEIGAVRFTRDGVQETFQTLVNPRKSVPAVVQNLTGIREEELSDAPGIEVVADDFERFIAGSILVGHNATNFDVPVLDRQGLRHPHEVYDTQQLSEILLPARGQYGLADLVEHFAIEFPVRHRALADAEASRLLFLALCVRAAELPEEVTAQIAQWLLPTSFPWRGFFREAWGLASQRPPVNRPVLKAPCADALRALKPRPDPVPVSAEEPLRIFSLAARRPDVFAEFDDRVEQRRMLETVTNAFNEGGRLMVEAGTGTGKSLAYLLPAACVAAANSSRVVVSTSTINLQEQLTKMDIPAVQTLEGSGTIKACQLKGRRNYLCLRRFNALRTTGVLTDDEARLASRILVWLGDTDTGDRAELRMGPEDDATWARLSADGADCSNDNSPFVVDGSCFLQRARRTAEASHIVVVNHSLLLSDIATGGRVVPPYEHLVIDEAHHLEDEATRQFGFMGREKLFFDLLDRCDGLVPALERALGNSPVIMQARQEMGAIAGAVREAGRAVRPHLRALCDLLTAFLTQQAAPGDEQKLLITRASRAQPDWSEIEIAWENTRVAFGALAQHLERLADHLREAENLGMLNQDLVLAEAGSCLGQTAETMAGMSAAIEADDPKRIVWLEMDRGGEGIVVAWVPLEVADLLQGGLYADRKTVVLTGATLRTQGGFAYLQQRLGLEDCETLALGSPFDYVHQALVLVPRDMPDPNSPIYIDALGQAIIDTVRASKGRALVLFTSHAMLRAAYREVAETLRNDNITALAQGIDGSPRQLVRALRSDPATVLLGTSSFWEGVDIPGEHLSLLIIARLPFAVPTDPVFAARSAMYEDPFNEFALPQAVIRFKQGFGRLIRTKKDRGLLVVLDQRIVAKEYGRAFLASLPGPPVRQTALRDMPATIENFLRMGVPAAPTG